MAAPVVEAGPRSASREESDSGVCSDSMRPRQRLVFTFGRAEDSIKIALPRASDLTTLHTRSARATPASPASLQRQVVSLLLVGAVAVAVGLLSTIAARAEFRPLVPKAGWSVTGQFPRFPILASPLEVPTDALAVDDLVLWRSWNPETQGTQGTVTSAPFMAPAYLAVPHLGFPGEVPGNRVFLRCSANGAEMEVARLRTNTGWATAFIKMPSTFCAAPVVLVATAAGHSQFYVGVGTPFAISAATYRAQVGYAPRALVVLLTWAMLSCLVLAGGVLAASLGFTDALSAGFVGVGATALLLFVLFHFSPLMGTVATWILLAGAAWFVYAVRARHRPSYDQVAAQVTGPLVVWLAVALAYAGFVSSADSGGGSWAINGLFTPLRWSSDNQLPYLFAEALFDGTPRHQITWGPWLASDRTPLLAAVLLLPRTAAISWMAEAWGSTFIPTAYMMAGITVLSSWVAAVIWLARAVPTPRVPTLVLVMLLSPFVFFDTLYTWPKLLGGTYVVFSFGILYRMAGAARSEPAALLAVAACAALAYLSHASNAFALLPVAALFSGTIWRQGLRANAVAVLVAAGLLLPWLVWQATVQPGGNALLRYALANGYGAELRSTPLLDSAVDAYRRLGFTGWLWAKWNAWSLVLGANATASQFGEVARHSPGLGWLGAQRVLDFFVTGRSLGIALVGLFWLAVATAGRTDSPSLTLARHAALAGLLGIGLMITLTLPRAVMHHQAFGSLLLLVFSGGVAIAQLRPAVSRSILALTLAYFVPVWLVHPLAVADRLEWTGILGAVYGVIATTVAGVWAGHLEEAVPRLSTRR